MNLKSVSHKGVNFIVCSRVGQTEMNYLRSNFDINYLHLEDHVNKTEFPKIESAKKYILFVFPFPHVANGSILNQSHAQENKNTRDPFRRLLHIPHKTFSYIHVPKFRSYTKKDRISTIYTGIYIGKDFVVFINETNIPQIDHILEMCQKTIRARDEFLGQGPGFLAYKITDALLDGYFPIVNAVSSVIDRIDREIENKQSAGTLEEISITRRNTVVLHTMIKIMMPLFRRLKDGIYKEINGNLQSFWGNVLDHSESLLERVEDDRELIEGISESSEFLLRTRTNEVMTALTIVFTLTVPASVLGTFYGMNIAIPGGIGGGSWTFFGPLTTFYLISGISVLFMIAMILYFKYKRWF